MVWLNRHNVRDLRTPFGGVKASGLGHEGGYRSHRLLHRPAGRAHHPRRRPHPTFGAYAARCQDAAMTHFKEERTLMTNFVPTPTVPAPDIVRCAYMELVVTDLAASRAFYVDVLGLHVTEEDENAIYLRSLEEFIHHNLVLRKGPVAAVAAFAYRVQSPDDVDARRGLLQGTGLPHRAPHGRLHQRHRRLRPRRGPE